MGGRLGGGARRRHLTEAGIAQGLHGVSGLAADSGHGDALAVARPDRDDRAARDAPGTRILLDHGAGALESVDGVADRDDTS